MVVMLPRLETCPNNDPRDVVYYTHMEQVLPAVWLATNVKNNYTIDYRQGIFFGTTATPLRESIEIAKNCITIFCPSKIWYVN